MVAFDEITFNGRRHRQLISYIDRMRGLQKLL